LFSNFDKEAKRPYILALTASPIKEKISSVESARVEEVMQKVSNNLYSTFLKLDPEDLQKMRSDVTFQIADYPNDFDQIVTFLTSGGLPEPDRAAADQALAEGGHGGREVGEGVLA